MKQTASLAAGLIVLASASSGCLLDPCRPVEGRQVRTGVYWDIPGMHDVFPPPGVHSGYRVEWNDDAIDGNNYRRAENGSMFLAVRPDNHTSWGITAEKPISDEQTTAMARQTFLDLNLTPPDTEGLHFRWSAVDC